MNTPKFFIKHFLLNQKYQDFIIPSKKLYKMVIIRYYSLPNSTVLKL